MNTDTRKPKVTIGSDLLPRFEELFQRILRDEQPKLKELMERMVREKIEFETDYRLVHPGGAVRDIHSTVHPVLSPSGDLIEFMGTVIDVTERKRAEEELRSFWLPIPSLECLTPPATVWLCCVGVLIL
jgi:hypothetical protein